ncbi:MAG: hypothetical protein GY926_03965 [bacterium]|nr:hypothetical protein [bacterium]
MAPLHHAVTAAEDAGYQTGPTDCDFGAAEALGLVPTEGHAMTVSGYFDTKVDGVAAQAAFAARGIPSDVAVVQTFCLDQM